MRLYISRLVWLCILLATWIGNTNAMQPAESERVRALIATYIPMEYQVGFSSYYMRFEQRMQRFKQGTRAKRIKRLIVTGRNVGKVRMPETMMRIHNRGGQQEQDFYYLMGVYEEFLKKKSSHKATFWYRFGTYAHTIGHTIATWAGVYMPRRVV